MPSILGVMMILVQHHPGISVPDIEQARVFYEKLLGFE
jgi:catechol 2,3-dioxygenase-like lactoylglutathione lyase family enzyme